MTTIYVGNLPQDVKEDTLKKIFSRYGRVTGIEMVRGQLSRRARSYGLVEMPGNEEASTAVQQLNGQYFRGHFMRVYPARAKHA